MFSPAWLSLCFPTLESSRRQTNVAIGIMHGEVGATDASEGYTLHD